MDTLVVCDRCRRHVKGRDSACPFCKSAMPSRVTQGVLAFALVGMVAACYGPPGPDPNPDGGTGATGTGATGTGGTGGSTACATTCADVLAKSQPLCATAPGTMQVVLESLRTCAQGDTACAADCAAFIQGGVPDTTCASCLEGGACATQSASCTAQTP